MVYLETKAVIFDLDGVLVNSEPLYGIALNKVVEQEGVEPLTEVEARSLIGTTVKHTWDSIKEMRSLTKPFDYYLAIYGQILMHVFKSGLELQSGAMELVQSVKKNGIPLGLATSSYRDWVNVQLDAVGMSGIFDAIVTGDEVQNGKPSPEIYLTVAQLLNINPTDCLAIEDSPSGIDAAVSSGIYTVAIKTDETAGLNISKANQIVNSLAELNIGHLDVENLSKNPRSVEVR